MRSLVVQTSFLGDMVLTTPLLALLAARGPVDVVATPANAGLLANHPAVRRIIIFDKRGVDRGLAGVWRMARRVRAGAYDAAFMAQSSLRSGALVRAAGIPARVGFAGAAGRVFYTKRVQVAPGMHHTERLLALGLALGLDPARPDAQPDATRAAV
ncbi:MAG TPA: glycosyltransferase family 9 protein, partial [Gemmatimonadaceae bacterium]